MYTSCNMEKTNKPCFFYGWYSDKPWVFDQSERVPGPIYIIKFITLLLYSWRFSRYSAPIHWLVHGHMICNNKTEQHCENYDIKWETVHCYPRNVNRCCMWSKCAVKGGLMLSQVSQHVFQNLLLFCFARAVFKWLWKNQNQSNYSNQSQQEQTAPWTNHNS